jgi:hypothetical protein
MYIYLINKMLYVICLFVYASHIYLFKAYLCILLALHIHMDMHDLK